MQHPSTYKTFVQILPHASICTSQVVEDIEVKKFFNENREGPKDGNKKMERSKDVIDGQTARAVFKVLQVQKSTQHQTHTPSPALLTQRPLAAVFVDIRRWYTSDVVQ
jgi:hypothetical protein